MPTIRQLPPDVVAKIAAGEVVERPASVVKELVENSLDAMATRIDIDIEQGGLELIRVVDNGHGLPAEDMPLALAPHATSKLESADDLFDLLTMGFRGEALASIAGVSQLTLQSRPEGSTAGHELRCDGTALSDLRPWGGATGTRIEVRHLFYNIPARKAFLKSSATELGHITEVITRLALANPQTHFVLKHNAKLVYDLPAVTDLADRIGLFFGAEVQDHLYFLDSGPNTHRLTGWIVDPRVNRGNSKWQYLYVNGRWFRDRTLAHAFQEAYRGLLMTGRYAVGFLYIQVPPDTVDINVHPQKHEVRFREQAQVYSLVRATVKARLMKEHLLPQLELPTGADDTHAMQPLQRPTFPEVPPPDWPSPNRSGAEQPRLFSPRDAIAQRTIAPWEEPAPKVTSTQQQPTPVHPPEVVHEPQTSPVEPKSEASFTQLPRGAALQVHDAYIVLESDDGMLVIDQHALHERILYEQLRQRIRTGQLEVQRLLIPEALELPPVQAAAVLEHAEQLASLGLEVSDFGGNTIILSCYPTLLERRAPVEILKAVIDDVLMKERPPSKEAMLDHLLATMACKAAVKAGDKLTQDEIAYLLKLRDFAEDSHHCPHGRPTSLVLSRQQLDKQFGRI